MSENHDQNFSLMQGETNNPGGMGTMLGFRITRMIEDTNPSGISSHLHYCWVYLGKTIVKASNHMTAGAWTGFESGSGINQPEGAARPITDDKRIPGATHFEMPKIAQSWSELREILQSSGGRLKEL